MKQPRLKCANKSCRQWFYPVRNGQVVCCFECASIHGKEQIAKKRLETQRAEARSQRAAQKIERATWRERKASVKKISHWVNMTQRAYNDWRREYLLSLGHGCISCGTKSASAWHAGHYRTTAAASQLRFTDDNVWLQCSACNVHKSGNIEVYRVNLVILIGEPRVLVLECNSETHQYTREELAIIRANARANLRSLKKNGDAW